MHNDSNHPDHSSEACVASARAVRDALYVLNGKWKLPLLIALQNGPRRFNELQRILGDITPKVLAKELQEMQLNGFIVRKVDIGMPVIVSYELTDYSASLDKVLEELRNWGMLHREKIMAGPTTDHTDQAIQPT